MTLTNGGRHTVAGLIHASPTVSPPVVTSLNLLVCSRFINLNLHGNVQVISAGDNNEDVLLLSLFRFGTLLVRSVSGVLHTLTTAMPMVRLLCIYYCKSVSL